MSKSAREDTLYSRRIKNLKKELRSFLLNIGQKLFGLGEIWVIVKVLIHLIGDGTWADKIWFLNRILLLNKRRLIPQLTLRSEVNQMTGVCVSGCMCALFVS